LDNGKAGRQLSLRYFGRMRSARVIFVTRTVEPKSEPEPEPEPESSKNITESAQEPVVGNQTLVTESTVSAVPQSEQSLFVPGMRIKTNSAGLALAMANLALEFDFAKRWSLDIPAYYSSWNYFKPTLKFRTLAL
jgi:hypothetical protein